MQAALRFTKAATDLGRFEARKELISAQQAFDEKKATIPPEILKRTKGQRVRSGNLTEESADLSLRVADLTTYSTTCKGFGVDSRTQKGERTEHFLSDRPYMKDAILQYRTFRRTCEPVANAMLALSSGRIIRGARNHVQSGTQVPVETKLVGKDLRDEYGVKFVVDIVTRARLYKDSWVAELDNEHAVEQATRLLFWLHRQHGGAQNAVPRPGSKEGRREGYMTMFKEWENAAGGEEMTG